MTTSQHQKLRQAESQVDAIMGFYIHLAVYVLVIGGLVVVDALNTTDGWWVHWPALGWGLGLLGHAYGVYGRIPRFIVEWRLRKIRRISTET